ncbi:MAG: MFS transporter [Bacteroidota bacterium]
MHASETWRRNFILNLGDGAFFNAGMAFIAPTAILPLFVSHYTPSPWMLGLLSALYYLGLTLPQPWGAARLTKTRDFGRSMRFLFLLPRLALFGLAFAPWLPKSWVLPWFFLFFGLFSFLLGYQIPLWYAFLDQFLPSEKRGMFFGCRGATGGVFGLFAALAAGWCLKALPLPQSYGLCFFLAFLCISLSYLCVTATSHPWATPQGEPFWEAAKGLWKENSEFQGYLIGRLAIATASMAMAFYVVHAKERFGLSVATSSLLAIALAYFPAILGVLWGPLADRWGTKPIQVAGSLIAALATVLLLVAPSLPGYAIGLFLVGCGQVSINQLDGKRLLEIDARRKGAVVSLFNLFLMPAMAALPLGAGWLATLEGIPPVIGITAVAWIFGGISLALTGPSLKPQEA